MIPGTIRETFLGDFAVVILLDDVLFSHTEIIDFTYINKLNEQPRGFFRIVDLNSDFMRTGSATYGQMLFTNTTDNEESKFSILDFYVESMVNEKVEAGNSIHRITWHAGTSKHNKKITVAYTDTSSTKVMEQIFGKAGVSNIIKFPDDIPQPDDPMTWVIPQSNMWEQLDSVVSKSYRQNDYIFWVWDDVNNVFKISSFDVEKKLSDKYILVESESAAASTKSGKGVAKDGSFVLWLYDNVQTMNRLGIDYAKIFPNISFSGIIDGNMESTGFKQKSFIEMLHEFNDDKIDTIIDFEKGNEVTYGNLVVKRHWPNNVHKMYSFADVYRDYKLSLHAKRVGLQIYNNVGPPMGSKVTFIKTADAFKHGNTSYDTLFSDKYIVLEKIINYNAKMENVESESNTKMTSANFITTITLGSDNFSTDTTGSEEMINEAKQTLSI